MVQSAWKYVKNNLFGNWGAGTANVLPAVLTTWANLLGTQGNKTEYELYKEQAQSYIDNARENAQMIKNQGEIALRNLSYKQALERGNDVVRVASSGSGMGGSNLDVVIRKEKIRKMNEATIRANYTNQAMMEMVNGYRNARSTYGTLAQKAEGDKYSALAAVLKGVETYVGLSVRDAKVASNIEANRQGLIDYEEETIKYQDELYNTQSLEQKKFKESATNMNIKINESLFDSNSNNFANNELSIFS